MAKTLPKAPQHEGVDPLTKSPTYHSPENVRESSTLGKEDSAQPEPTTDSEAKTSSKSKK